MSLRADASTAQVDAEGDANAAGDPAPSSTKALCPKIYLELLKDTDRLWNQDDILGLDIVPNDDVALVASCMSVLFEQHKIQTMTRGGGVVWKVIEADTTARYKGLSHDETIVYSHIDTAQNMGVWTQRITRISHLHQDHVQKAIRKLLQKNLIKHVVDVNHPTRKVVMLSHLEPSIQLTGGTFYTGATLDEDVVFFMQEQALKYIASQSWDWGSSSSRKPRKSEAPPSAEEARNMRSAALEAQYPLPFPPGYTNYPSASDVTRHLNSLNVVKATMKEDDVAQILQILRWDGLIVAVGGGYKSVRSSKMGVTERAANTNGLAEAPCGRCPVFEWCEDDGPINAKTCPYFADWLAG